MARIKRTITAAKEQLKLAKKHWEWEPHRTQREWLMAQADVKVAACGRRWGKTEAGAYDAATFALHHPASVQMIVSPTYDQSRLIFGTVERLILGRDDLRTDTKCVKTPYPLLTLKNGSTIMARTADEDGRNLRGHSADRVIVDEAAFVKDAVVEEVISPMLADRNGQLILISTPFGKNHFYRAFVRGQEGNPRYKSFTFPSWENPHVSREYIESQRDVISERQFAVEYEAQFMDDQNSVFKWEDIQAAVDVDCGTGNAGLQKSSYLVAGVDWARYSDYSAVVILDALSEPYRVVEINRFNGLSWNRQVERVCNLVKEHGVSTVLMDQTSMGDPLLEQTENNLYDDKQDVRVEGLVFTNQSKREIIDNLAALLCHRMLAIPNDEKLIKELHYYEYEITPSGNMRMNARRGYTDDLVTALALAAHAAKTHAPGDARAMAGGERIAGNNYRT